MLSSFQNKNNICYFGTKSCDAHMVSNIGYKTYNIGQVTQHQTNIILCNGLLPKHCGSDKDFEIAGILFCVIFV